MIKYLLCILLLSAVRATAQPVKPSGALVGYAFDNFSPGIIKMKSGETYNQVLNYNVVTNEMIFENNGKYLAIANPENVDTVTIDQRKFIYLNNKFYEILFNSKMPFLLEYTATVKEPGTSSGYGTTSNTSSASSFKSLINQGGSYSLEVPDGYSVIPGYDYWIMKNGQLEKAGNERQLEKIFPQKKNAIKDFMKKNQTNFSKREDIIMLVKGLE
ncbi:MAG: hypothetical protein ABI267_10190 [Ginsengibacter sp.]